MTLSKTSLYSTLFPRTEESRLTLAGIRRELALSDHVRVAAAYYDSAFLRKLFDRRGGVFETLQSIELLFNGLAGERLDQQRKELIGLQKQLKARGFHVDTRLAFVDGIFHAKVFLGRRQGRVVGFVGSANATNAAFSKNEEILLHIHPNGVSGWRYFQRVWDNTYSLSEIEEYTARSFSFTQFFRTGVLFFKPSVSLQTTINPFAKLMESLRPQDRARMTANRLPYSDPRPKMDAFDLKRAAQGQRRAPPIQERRTKTSLKPYSIETCLGYWVPTAYLPQVTAIIERGREARLPRIEAVRAALVALRESTVRTTYGEYLAKARERLANIDLSRYLTDIPDPFDVERAVVFHKRLLDNLARDEFRNRLASPFLKASMPEIWDDSQMRREFEDSFFAYLEYVAGGTGRGTNIARTLQRRCGYSEGDSDETIRIALEAILHDTGWGRDDWGA